MGTTGQSITLANSIIGVGILAMPYCFQQCGVLLATLILILMGLVSRLCCYFLLKSALIARRRNFEFLAFHVFGRAGKLAVEVGIIGFLMGTCIAYFVVVGDLGPQIIAKLFNINQSDILRTSIMVIVSLVCVLPLGLLRNVDSLSNVSAATIGFYFCLVMKVLVEAASQMLSSDWQTRIETWKPSGVLQCVPIFSMALFCQTQLFEIFESLPTLSLEKMNVVTKNAINICTAVYFTLGLFGYIAFCSRDISGNILMSLTPTMANDVIKLGFVMSLAFSFPLIIFPCRASLYSFLYKKVHSSHHDHIVNHSIPEASFRVITVAIIAVALFISLLIPNIELVLGLVGSTIGVLICVVFPAACFVNVTFKNTNERVLAKVILVLGLVIMVLGTFANLQAAESKLDRYDDIYSPEHIDKMVEDFFEKKDKSEGVMAKPLTKTNGEIQDDTKHKLTKDVIDSEAQPPNPIPPEPQSNENNQPTLKPIVDEEKIIEKHIPDNSVDKASETHPKNLLTKLNELKTSNEKKEREYNNKEKLKEEVKPSPEEKIDMIKQQELIETIKQHGEEQKELIKEQKEILHEIRKTKEELHQTKIELENKDAKKIAVESIQKIASMAIQSLSEVSDKPNGAIDKKSEPLDAVQEIAKKAVETIQAIKEAKEKSDNEGKAKSEINEANILKRNVADLQPINAIDSIPIQNNVQPNQNEKQNGQNPNPPLNINNEHVHGPAANQDINQNYANSQPLVKSLNNLASVNQAIGNDVEPNKNQQPVKNANVAQVAAINNIDNQPIIQAAPVDPVHANQNQLVQPAPNNIVSQPLAQFASNNNDVVSNQPLIHVAPENNNLVENQFSAKAARTNNVVANQLIQAAPINNDVVANHPKAEVAPNHNVIVNQAVAQAAPIKNDVIANHPIGSNNNNLPKNQPIEQAASNNNLAAKPINDEPAHDKSIETVDTPIKNVHSHSPDEPQSYKQGEDAQKTNIGIKDVPLPLAVNGNSQLSNNNAKHSINVKLDGFKETNGAIEHNLVNEDLEKTIANVVAVRQKREVVDCTEKYTLKQDDKKIYDTIVSSPDFNMHSLDSNVDLNNVVLPKSLPLDTMIHHLRSLQSYDETDKKR